MATRFATRQLRRDELDIIAKWMLDETWHISHNILASCYELDPRGWIAAEAIETKELIGTITGCRLDANTAFGGFFIVRPDWRRRGVGKALWEERMRHLGSRNFGIDAVEARVQYDLKNGFHHLSFPIAAYLGEPKREKLERHGVASVALRKYDGSAEEYSKIENYDFCKHVIPRVAFFRQWVDVKITTTFVAYNASSNEVMGFGCIQPIEGGHYHVGPVFADTPEIGKMLMTELFLNVPEGRKVGFDIPLDNATSVEVSKQHEMLEELKLYRMYTSKVLDFEMEKVFAFTTMGIALV